MFIFLDFDGVLHSNHGPTSALWSFLPRFESVPRDFPDAKVVISSSWGDGRLLEELRAFFSPDIRLRIVDKVQSVRRRILGHADRGRACAQWCRGHQLSAGDWLAIDDDRNLFCPSHPLILCINGFREAEALQLRMTLANEIPAWRFAFEAVDELFDREFDRDAQRTRQHVLEHRPEVGGGQTAVREKARGRREAHPFPGCSAVPGPPLTDAQMIERDGYAPEQLRPYDLLRPGREREE